VRVVLVSPYDLTVPGGVQGHVHRLADALRHVGDEVLVIGAGPGSNRPPRSTGVGRTVQLPYNGSVAPIALGPMVASRTRTAIGRLRPDVVHVHEPLVPFVGIAAASYPDAPVVGTFHAWSDQARLYRAGRVVARRITSPLAARIAVSSAAARFHAEALGIGVEDFTIIPNGVETARFAAARHRHVEPARTDVDHASGGRGDDAPTVLFVGRLEERKGLAVLLAAARRRWDDGHRLRVLVVGDGPGLAAARRAVPVRHREDVTFLGRVDDDALVAAHEAADLFVSPALGGESFGIVLLEAMAAGTPVIASDIPGYRTVVTDTVDARLVPPGDVEALAAMIGTLQADGRQRARLVQAGCATADAHDWRVVAERIRACYLDAVSTAGARG
jgi:phosphatidyl-myo-inositol alpha-mannosyltransferase